MIKWFKKVSRAKYNKERYQKETLLLAAIHLLEFCYPDGKWRGTIHMKGILNVIQPLRDAVNVCKENK
jgi:ribosomal protein L32